MYLDLITLLAVLLLAIILAFYNRRQAEALRGVERMTKDFLAMQIKDRRKEYTETMREINPLHWLDALINKRTLHPLELRERTRLVEEVSAAEFSCADGRRVVVSTKDRSALRQWDKTLRVRRGDSATARIANLALKPLLGRKTEVLEVNMIDEGEYFDLEAETVGKELGLSWSHPARLWIYVIG